MSDLSNGYCKRCKTRKPCTRNGTNHILHLLLTLVTVGLWIPMWLLLSLRIGGWRCRDCATKIYGLW